MVKLTNACYNVGILFADTFLEVQPEEHKDVEMSSSVVANVYGKQSIQDLLNAPPQQPCISTSLSSKLSNSAETTFGKPSREQVFLPPPSSPQDIKPKPQVDFIFVGFYI